MLIALFLATGCAHITTAPSEQIISPDVLSKCPAVQKLAPNATLDILLVNAVHLEELYHQCSAKQAALADYIKQTE